MIVTPTSFNPPLLSTHIEPKLNTYLSKFVNTKVARRCFHISSVNHVITSTKIEQSRLFLPTPLPSLSCVTHSLSTLRKSQSKTIEIKTNFGKK